MIMRFNPAVLALIGLSLAYPMGRFDTGRSSVSVVGAISPRAVATTPLSKSDHRAEGFKARIIPVLSLLKEKLLQPSKPKDAQKSIRLHWFHNANIKRLWEKFKQLFTKTARPVEPKTPVENLQPVQPGSDNLMRDWEKMTPDKVKDNMEKLFDDAFDKIHPGLSEPPREGEPEDRKLSKVYTPDEYLLTERLDQLIGIYDKEVKDNIHPNVHALLQIRSEVEDLVVNYLPWARKSSHGGTPTDEKTESELERAGLRQRRGLPNKYESINHGNKWEVAGLGSHPPGTTLKDPNRFSEMGSRLMIH